jgi:hypothetical protein
MVEILYAVLTLVSVAAGLTMVGMGIRAYAQTSRTAMLHIAVGFWPWPAQPRR